MQNNGNFNDNLYKFSALTPWRFIAVVLLYAVGAASFPPSIFYNIFGESRAAVCFSNFLARAICSIIPVWLIFEIKLKQIFNGKLFLKNILPILPFYIVALNNFPFLPLIKGNVEFIIGEAPEFALTVFCYVLMCLGISFLEESVFRGIILNVIFRKFCKNKNGTELKRGAFLSIILSSAIFGGAHLVNLFAGAGVGATILQVGYSFLIGSMCALAAVKSGNFYHAVALHAIFDFGGLLESKGLIEGVIWTTKNMILTAAVGLIVCVYAIVLFIKNKNNGYLNKIIAPENIAKIVPENMAEQSASKINAPDDNKNND
ncbi:MAG: type II CAAX endopeptidase family protein [Candidatus Borkfalkiaceae bacterium]|nr:type II CAAX endopeptidase family protein [Christensenellaceae bacterium]